VERVGDRVAKAGYRRDERGLVAYLFTPEAWTTSAYTAFVMAAGGTLAASLIDGATGGVPLINVPLRAAAGYWFIVRPVLRVAARRATRQASSGWDEDLHHRPAGHRGRTDGRKPRVAPPR